MKFNEKLIKLRKEKGFSQEELGYELGVTRQTVSKWELGLTTPEMGKLRDISKLFNISIDNLLSNGEEKNNKEEKNMEEENNKFIGIGEENISKKPNKKTSNKGMIIAIVGGVLIVLILLCLVVLAINKGNQIFKSFSPTNKMIDEAVEMQKEMINEGKEMQEEMINEGKERQNEALEKQKEIEKEHKEMENRVTEEINEGKEELEKKINEAKEELEKAKEMQKSIR